MIAWNDLSTEQKLEQLRQSQVQWRTLFAPRFGELRELIDAQERMIERLTRRIEALESSNSSQLCPKPGLASMLSEESANSLD